MAPLTEGQVGLYVQQRLGIPDTSRLRLQSLISSALNNLSLKVANDYQKRKWLMTDPATVTSTVTSSSGQYYTDLSTIISTYGVMKDYLMYGTVFWNNSFSFASTDVSTLYSTITVAGHGMNTGDPVRFTTSGTLPGGLDGGGTYYAIATTAGIVRFAATATQAFDNDYIMFDFAGSGNSTCTVYGLVKSIQWIDSPVFALTTNALPIHYVYGWLVANKLYLSQAGAGTISYNVPFVPTLNTLPDFLQNDILDEVVNLAIAAGQELPKAAAER